MGEQVFSSKYSLTLPATALTYIEQVLLDVSDFSYAGIVAANLRDQNEIAEEEWQTGLELWAKEYLKGEGVSAQITAMTKSHAAYRLIISGVFTRVEESIRGPSNRRMFRMSVFLAGSS
jgi:DNA polymerase epsilon subunit 2